MKFNLASIQDVIDLVNKLSIGLRKLTFEDNMESFSSQDLEIPVWAADGDEVSIRNKLTFIPDKYIITAQTGNGIVAKTGTWNKDFLYLINYGPNPVVVTVIFMR